MGLFKRRQANVVDEPDGALPFLSVDDAQRVRTLVRDEFARQGMEVTVHADHVRGANGEQFGLWNVAAKCHEAGKHREWPQVVKDHAASIVAAMNAPSPFDDLTPEDAKARTYVRLYATADMPGLDDFPHREFAPGLVEMLALDLPDTIATYTNENAERFGGWETLRAYGLDNLRREPRGTPQEVEYDNAHFDVLEDASFYTASRAVLLPEGLDEQPVENGWLLSVPTRHLLCWHVIRDISVVRALEGMALFSMRAYADGVATLTPDVYWWSGNEYVQTTQWQPDGTLAIVAGDELQSMLEGLAGSDT